MKYTKLGNSELNVSRICMGCMGFGDPGRGQHSWTIDEEHTREIMKRSLELGVNFFDTAIAYQSGTSEQYVGRALRDFAERVVVHELGGSLPRADQVRYDVDPVLKVPYTDLSKITNKIIMIVKSSYRHPQTLTAIAESMHMSGKYIGRIFLRDTGIKFSEYLMAYRMLEARKLIAGTQEKISVIAGMVGYGQLNHFYIHFRRYFGVSPSALREFGGGENA